MARPKKVKPVYTYRVRDVTDGNVRHDTYRIEKSLYGGVGMEQYLVELPKKVMADDLEHLEPEDVYCNCMGYRMQKYDKRLHKHVQLVFDFVRRGQPLFVDYTLADVDNEVIHVRTQERA